MTPAGIKTGVPAAPPPQKNLVFFPAKKSSGRQVYLVGYSLARRLSMGHMCHWVPHGEEREGKKGRWQLAEGAA